MLSPIDTVFALLSLAQGAEAEAAERHLEVDHINYAAVEAAWEAVDEAGIERSKVETLAICDFTKPSYLHRLIIHHRDECRPKRYLCAHGTNTGDLFATSFSNRSGSLQTSLGLYRVGKHYGGQWGRSIELHGLEPGRNDRAYARKIVLHSAWYVSEEIIGLNIAEGLGPRIGRSQGCPAVPEEQLTEVCQQLPAGAYLYVFGVDPEAETQ
ncbi:MAG: murein L,D-transpeptidase catalytic domain family protein [Verrucomicrobiota bacterium]